MTAVLIALILTTAAGVSASTFRGGDNIHITSLHHIDDDFYAYGQNVIINGAISGDLLAIGYRSAVRGEIGGSANFLCRVVNHSGRINRSLRATAEHLDLNGYIGGSLLAVAREIVFGQGSVIEKDAHIYGADVSIDGVIKGSVSCAGTMVHISGLIEGDVAVESDHITLSPPAVIKGNLIYTSSEEDALATAAGVTVAGEIIWKEPETDDAEASPLVGLTFRVSTLLAAFLFGIILLKLFRQYVEESVYQLKQRFSVSLAAGMLGILVLALCLVVLLLSLISTGIGCILVQGETAVLGVPVLVFSILMLPISSSISLAGGIFLYTGKIIVAFVLGFLILGRKRSDQTRLSGSALFVGLIVLAMLFWLPYVGGLVYFVTGLAGVGAIILGIKNCRRQPPPPSVSAQESSDRAG